MVSKCMYNYTYKTIILMDYIIDLANVRTLIDASLFFDTLNAFPCQLILAHSNVFCGTTAFGKFKKTVTSYC